MPTIAIEGTTFKFKGGGVNTAKRVQWRGILFIIGWFGGDISYVLYIQSSQMEGINSTK